MASAAENVATLNRYLDAGGELGALSTGAGGMTASTFKATYNRAMKELVSEATYDRGVRQLFASESMFERTLSPPLLVQSRVVRPSLQEDMLIGIHRSCTGGYWRPVDRSGITEWLGSEAGGRAYFLATLNSPARVVDGLTIELAPEVLAAMLSLVRDAALPASWFEFLADQADQRVFEKIEIRVSESRWPQGVRRALLALLSQARARVSTELAKLAVAQIDAFPAFPTGETLPSGQKARAPTPPPPPKAWYRTGWAWLGVGAGAVGGGLLAARR